MPKLRPINNNILVHLDLKNTTDNGFTFSEEIKGDGQVVKCKVIQAGALPEGSYVYIPFYALREIRTNVFACDYESIIAVDE